jgi:hypothetical protein
VTLVVLKDESIFLASLENLFKFEGGVGIVGDKDKKVIKDNDGPVFEVSKYTSNDGLEYSGRRTHALGRYRPQGVETERKLELRSSRGI